MGSQCGIREFHDTWGKDRHFDEASETLDALLAGADPVPKTGSSFTRYLKTFRDLTSGAARQVMVEEAEKYLEIAG